MHSVCISRHMCTDFQDRVFKHPGKLGSYAKLACQEVPGIYKYLFFQFWDSKALILN